MVERKLLPAGEAYLSHVRRAVHNLTFEEHDKHAEEERKRLEALNGSGAVIEDDLGVGDEAEGADLLLLDPKEWKVRTRLLFRALDVNETRATETRSLCCPRPLALAVPSDPGPD